MPGANKIILFDGVCNLCNGWVQFIIPRDKGNVFLFAALQSDVAKELLSHSSAPVADNSTIMVVEQEKIYTQSTAVLRIVRNLSGLWPLLYCFIILPPFIRDGIYRFIARNRYRWFGRQNTCTTPVTPVAHKFLA